MKILRKMAEKFGKKIDEIKEQLKPETGKGFRRVYFKDKGNRRHLPSGAVYRFESNGQLTRLCGSKA